MSISSLMICYLPGHLFPLCQSYEAKRHEIRKKEFCRWSLERLPVIESLHWRLSSAPSNSTNGSWAWATCYRRVPQPSPAFSLLWLHLRGRLRADSGDKARAFLERPRRCVQLSAGAFKDACSMKTVEAKALLLQERLPSLLLHHVYLLSL